MSYNTEMQSNNAELQEILDAVNNLPDAGSGTGTPGVGIASIQQTTKSTEDDGVNVITVTLTDGSKSTFEVENGSKGSKGDKGDKGDSIKGDKGDKGDTGSAGKDGTSVTVKSVSESTADGGSNVVTFSDGKTVTIKNGSKGSDGKDGSNGADGYSPVKGTDYWTPADKQAILAELGSQLSLGIASDGLIYLFVNGSPVGTGIPQSTGESGDVFGYVDENNTIVLTGALADGTYSIKYEMENGTVVNIGDMVLDSNVYYSVIKELTNCTISNSAKTVVEGESYSATITANDGYELSSVKVTMGGTDISASAVSGGNISIAEVTGNIVITAVAEEIVVEVVNQIPLSTDANGNLFNGGQGWKTGYRLGGDGTEKALSGIEVTGFIPISYGDTIYMKNITDDGTHIMGVYNSSHAKIGTRTFTNIFGGAVSGELLSMVVDNNWATETGASSGVAYLRVSATEITADSIITVNEPIV